MSEHSQRTLAICATILIEGLLFSIVLLVRLAKFNENFRLKTFYGQGESFIRCQTAPLVDGEFVVVNYSGETTVYQVDANCKLSRTSGVDKS